MRIAVPSAPIACALVLALAGTASAAGEGGPFQTRDPLTCASTVEPKSGPPSAAQAKRYFQCHAEHADRENIYLVTNVKVQVGAARPFMFAQDSGGEIDTTKPVYPIRGSFRTWICSPVSAYMQNAGKNCQYGDQPAATGACRHTTFGDWRCEMFDPMNHFLTGRNVPGPK